MSKDPEYKARNLSSHLWDHDLPTPAIPSSPDGRVKELSPTYSLAGSSLSTSPSLDTKIKKTALSEKGK